jgi:hypothetical protein
MNSCASSRLKDQKPIRSVIIIENFFSGGIEPWSVKNAAQQVEVYLPPFLAGRSHQKTKKLVASSAGLHGFSRDSVTE